MFSVSIVLKDDKGCDEIEAVLEFDFNEPEVRLSIYLSLRRTLLRSHRYSAKCKPYHKVRLFFNQEYKAMTGVDVRI
jgi:hypothetical protein